MVTTISGLCQHSRSITNLRHAVPLAACSTFFGLMIICGPLEDEEEVQKHVYTSLKNSNVCNITKWSSVFLNQITEVVGLLNPYYPEKHACKLYTVIELKR